MNKFAQGLYRGFMFKYKDLVNMDNKKSKEYLYNLRRRMVEAYLAGASYDNVAKKFGRQ